MRVSFPDSGVWHQRAKRAEFLSEKHSHASSLLLFYLQLIRTQLAVFTETKQAGLLTEKVVQLSLKADVFRDCLDQQLVQCSQQRFVEFVRTLQVSSTDVLADVAKCLVANPEVANRALRNCAQGIPNDKIGLELGCDCGPVEFFPRAFIQPIAEAIVQEGNVQPVGERTALGVCPYCESAPFASVLRDEPDLKGKRTLQCSLCASEWVFPRSCCPRCGEETPEQLDYHISEAWPHVRIEECRSCRTYLKAIDLRTNGLAVPVVDELASVELDLWASEQGMAKLQQNVLGL